MADRIDDLAGRVEVVEQKVGQLSTSVDQRFDQVDAALVEQRRYTEFAYERLDARMNAGFADVDARFASIDGHFNSIDGRFANVDGRFNSIEGHFNSIDGHFNSIDGRFNRVEGHFNRLEGHFNRLERKLDQFIDTQSTANDLVERRLQALEPPSAT